MAATIRILYVDDEPSLLDIGKLFLEKGGAFTVDTLTSAIVALEQLKTKRYDAIISDYQMPDMDGITFLKQLKASGNKTPFIIFTGRGREEVVIEALNNGADFYIQKGGEPKSQFAELSHKIKTAVSRQKTEKLAKETERRLYDIINFLPDATFAIDTDGTVIAWNKAIEEMTGVPAHEMLGRGNYEYAIPFYGERRPILINLVSIPDEELTRGKYAVIKKEGDILIAETTLPRPLGRYSVLLGKASLLFNDEGTAIGAIESIRDITEQKQVEEALAESGHQLDAMATNIPGVVYRFCLNPDGTYGFDYIGERSRQILGLQNDPFSFFDRVTEGIVPEERQRFISSVQHAINTKTLWEFDCWYVKPSGKKIWMSAVSSPVIENERLIFDGVIFDNTDRKRAEEELLKKNEELNASYEQIAAGEEELRANLDNITRQDLELSENEEKYRTVIEQSHDGIIIAQDGILVFHNPSFASLTGYSSEELNRRSIADLIAPEDRELVLTRHRERQLGKTLPEVYEFSVLHHDGTSRIRVSMNITSASIGGRAATIGTLHNITEERRREDALRESEEKLRLKLDSVLSPDVDLDEQDLANIIDTALIQSLMDDFFAVTGMPIGIVDLEGNVLVKTGWQDICNKFHRVHPETLKNCIESNLILSSGVPKGESRAYRCRNNMWDIVTPIFIGDKHIGNLFCGQFFYDDEVKNPQVFSDQAEKYGFDKDKYLATLNSVPRWSREKIKNTMQFYAKFAEMVSKLSYSNLKLAKMISTQKQVEASLMEQEEQSRMLLSSMPDIVMVHHDGIIVYANQMALEKTGFSEEELIGSHLFERVPETDREIILRNMKKRAAGEPVGEYEIDMIHKSGLLHHVIIRASPIMFNQLPSIVFIIIDITERKKAEDMLRESEEKYRLIFENSPLGHLSFDEKGIIVACNDKFIQIIGSSREALVGLNMLNLPDKNIVSAVKKALSGDNGLYEGVYSSVTAKKITPVRGLFAPMNFGEGRIPGGMGIFEDITERQQAELALQESEEKYRDIFENSVMGLFKTAPDGQMINANNALARMYGYLSAEKILNAGINVGQLYANIDDRKEVLNILSEKGKIENYETQHLKQDGTRFWVSITARTICNADGSVLFYEGTNLDITDRKEADEFIRLLARISDDAPASITVHDKEGNFLYANEKTLQLHGYTSEEFLKKNLHEIDVPESEQLIVKRMQQIQETGAADFDVQHFRKDGSLLPLHLNVKTVVWDKKKVLLSIATDLTERKNAEVLLKESELKYRSLIESSSDAIFCVDKNGEYKFTNLVFASTFDKTPEYFIGKTFWDIYPKEQADHRQLTNLKLFETGVTQTIEVEVPLPETTLYFIAKANPIKDETGKVILNLTHATDITERKRAERAIQQANQKLLLLSSITRHDINNQLTVLQGYLELVVMKQEDHNLIDYCQKAITAAQRIYAMIRFTKEYESLGISAPTWHDAHTLIETTAKQAPLGKVIVKNDIPKGNEMFADPLIIKVCYNLMDNAVQYGKKITMIRFSVLKHNDEHLIVCEDDGVGVLAEEKEKIFERGFGKNTGLGLALSREILSITGITIRETGDPGKGARFEMTVPKVMWRMTVREN